MLYSGRSLINLYVMRVLNEIKNLPRARNAEHWYLYDRLIALITVVFVTKYNLGVFFDKLKELFARESEAYSAITKSASTEVIADKDKARDSGLRRVDLGVQYGLYSDQSAEVEAAKRCMIVLDAHRGASEKSYAENTAEVADVVERFQSDEYAADIARLNLTEAVESLKQLNDDFQTAYSGRTPERYARVSGDKMKTIRAEVDAAYADVADAINAIYIVAAYLEPNAENAAEIQALADALNAEIYQFGLTLSRRGVGSVTEPADPSDPSDPGEPTDPEQPEGGDEGGTPGGV